MKLVSLLKFATLPASVVAVTLAFGGAAVPSIAAASPDDGVRCPAGYDSSFAGGALKCVKHVVEDISNSTGKPCNLDVPFTSFVRMPGNRDICLNADIPVNSVTSLSTLTNGKIQIVLPAGPINLPSRLGKAPAPVNGRVIVEINPNADFIFYDQSKTLQKDFAIASAKVLSKERTTLVPLGSDAELSGTTVQTSQDFFGALDKVQANINVFAFAQH